MISNAHPDDIQVAALQTNQIDESTDTIFYPSALGTEQ